MANTHNRVSMMATAQNILHASHDDLLSKTVKQLLAMDPRRWHEVRLGSHLGTDDYQKCLAWCRKNMVDGTWFTGHSPQRLANHGPRYFTFRSADDAMMFRLTWMDG
jgi:hypothetical protein